MQLPRVQFRLVVLMASIVFVGFGLAILRQPYQPWITMMLTLTIATLLTAALRAHFALTAESRAWWFGFSLFGWTHLILVASAWGEQLPTAILSMWLVDWYTTYFGPYPTPTGRGPWYTNAIHDANGLFFVGAMKLVELYFTLFVAGLGAMLTGALAAWLGERSPRSDDSESASGGR
jgi:hypothetical protein